MLGLLSGWILFFSLGLLVGRCFGFSGGWLAIVREVCTLGLVRTLVWICQCIVCLASGGVRNVLSLII